MNPKKHKEFNKGIADELQIHPEVVDDFISFYYSQLRKELSNLSAVNIYVQGLGTFSLKKTKLEKSIKRKKSMLGNLKKITYNGFEKSLAIQESLDLEEKALELVKEAIEKKKEFKKNKNGST